MKIMWLSNAPWVSTGYGNQTRLFVPRLKKQLGYDMAITAFYGLAGSVINTGDGIPIYPGYLDGFGRDIAASHAHHFGAKVCISLMDAWVIDPQAWIHGIKWIPWFPIDHDPIPKRVLFNVTQAYRRIVFTHFGEREMSNNGLTCYYVPHGVDTKIFTPIERKTARENLGFKGEYLIGMVAANKGNNPSRKAFMPQLEAFAEFHKRHPETRLYLHSMPGDSELEQRTLMSVNLVEYIKFLGLDNVVTLAGPHEMSLGYPDKFMVDLYNSMDVLLMVTMGEGFGIPLIEAQACGTPVITGDWTACAELCFSGQKIPKEGAEKYWTLQSSYQWLPHASAIYEALEQEYNHPSSREAARAGIVAEYDADLVTEKYWKPALAEIRAAVEDED